MTPPLLSYIDLAAEEAAAAISTAHGDGLEDGLDFSQARYMAEVQELAEMLNRAAAICHKPGVAELLGARIHSRRLARCVGMFDVAAAAEPEPVAAQPEEEEEEEDEPELEALPGPTKPEPKNAIERVVAWLEDNGRGTKMDMLAELSHPYTTINATLAALTSLGTVISDRKRPATYRLARNAD